MYREARSGDYLILQGVCCGSVRKQTPYLLRIIQSLNIYISLRTHEVEEAVPPLIVR